MSDSAPAMAPTKHLEPIGETFLEKAKRKTIEEPLVPVGCALTVMALYMATRQYRRGNRQSMNHWLRFRVAAQGFTVLAICTYGFAIRRAREKAKEAGEETAPFVQPATIRQQAREKQEFEQRLQEAVKAEQQESAQKEGEKPDWKAAWKEGLLKKNRENDEKRVKPTDRTH